MAAPMNPMNQALNNAITERDAALQEVQDMREAQVGWRWVRFGRGNHILAGLIFAIIGALLVVCVIWAAFGPKVGLTTLGTGLFAMLLFLLGSWALDRRNHVGQQP